MLSYLKALRQQDKAFEKNIFHMSERHSLFANKW